MPEERISKTLTELHCTESKDKKGIYECNKVQPEEEELDDESYMYYSSTMLKKLIQEQSNKNSSFSMISSITLTALIGGFGFAVAYMILYFLYDWVVNPTLEIDIVKLLTSILILLALLILLIVVSYYLIKKQLNINKKSQIPKKH